MKKPMKIAALGILGAVMNVACFIGLYQIGYSLTIDIWIFAVYLIPASINCLVFWNVLDEVSIKKQLIVFSSMSGFSLLCYGVFTYYFEKGAEYAAFIERNLDWLGFTGALRLQGETEGRFFAPLPFVFVFVTYLAVQYFVNGTRPVITQEDIDRIFNNDKKKK